MLQVPSIATPARPTLCQMLDRRLLLRGLSDGGLAAVQELLAQGWLHFSGQPRRRHA